jgi:hypothetical protein
MPQAIAGVRIPDSRMAYDLTQRVRRAETDLLFHHSVRAFLFGGLTGRRKGLTYDAELLYAGAMFHAVGLTEAYQTSPLRFEIDSANAARDFLRGYRIAEGATEIVWDAIALHATPGIPEHKRPEIALLAAGFETDILGTAYHEFTEAQREAVVSAHPRGNNFKQGFIDALYEGIKLRPETTFGTVNADVLAFKRASVAREDFCQMIRSSAWAS